MDPFLTITIITCFVLALWACGTLPVNEEKKTIKKDLPGVSDEKAHKSFMKTYGDTFKSSLSGLGFTSDLGIQEFIKKNKNKDAE